MAAITDLSDLVNRMTGGNSGTPEVLWVTKFPTIANTLVNATGGFTYSYWQFDGAGGGSGAVPTTVAAPTSATVGAIPFTDPGGGRQKWLVQGGLVTLENSNTGACGAITLYDRLLHIGDLDGTVTTAQTVGGTLTRNTGGVGNKIYVEIYSDIGTTERTITASYTNQAGTASRTTQATIIGGNYNRAKQHSFFELPLQDGDTGVQAVASVTISASTGTAGNFGITVGRPLAQFSNSWRWGDQIDFTIGLRGIPEIEAGACLATVLHGAVTSEHSWMLTLSTVEA